MPCPPMEHCVLPPYGALCPAPPWSTVPCPPMEHCALSPYGALCPAPLPSSPPHLLRTRVWIARSLPPPDTHPAHQLVREGSKAYNLNPEPCPPAPPTHHQLDREGGGGWQH